MTNDNHCSLVQVIKATLSATCTALFLEAWKAGACTVDSPSTRTHDIRAVATYCTMENESEFMTDREPNKVRRLSVRNSCLASFLDTS